MSRQQEDELFEIKNYYYIGNYAKCISEAQKLKKPSSPDLAVERDMFMFRSYIAQRKYGVVIEEVHSNSAKELQHVKLLARYLSKKSELDESILNEVDELVASNVSSDILAIVAATIYIREKNLESAYKVLHASDNLEALLLIIEILLRLDRPDLARKKLKEMQEKDDDATLTQLAQAKVNIFTGGDKFQEAYYIYQELIEKYSSSPLLLNGEAVALIGQGKYEEVDSILQEAYYIDSDYCDTLINLVHLSRHFGNSPEDGNKYMAQLKDLNPNDPFMLDIKRKHNDYLTICEQYSPSNPTIPA